MLPQVSFQQDVTRGAGLAKHVRPWHKRAIIKRRAGALANLPTGQGGFRNRDAAGSILLGRSGNQAVFSNAPVLLGQPMED
jgi:hypothetical protein